MIDVVTVGAGGGSIAWLSPEGTLKVGPQSAGADPGPLCYAKGGTEVTITDAHVVLGRIPPHLLGGEIPLDVDAARAGVEALAGKLGLEPGGVRHRHPGDLRLEPGQRAAPGHRQARPRRPRLHADHVRRLRLAAAVPADGHPRHPDRAGAAQPGQRLGVRAAHRRRQERLRADPRRRSPSASTPAPCTAAYDALTGAGGRGAGQGGLRRRRSTCSQRTADLRYFGQAFEVRVAGARGRRSTPRRSTQVADAFHAEHRALYGYDFAGDAAPAGRVGQPAGLRHRPDHAPGDPRVTSGLGRASGACAPVARRTTASHGRSASTPTTGTSTPRCSGGPTWPPGRRSTGPAIIEEFGSTVPLHPGFTARVDDYRNLDRRPGAEQ